MKKVTKELKWAAFRGDVLATNCRKIVNPKSKYDLIIVELVADKDRLEKE